MMLDRFAASLQPPQRADHARVALTLIVALIALAWLTLAVWSASPWRRWLDHGAWSDTTWLAELCRALPQGERMVPAVAYASAWLLMALVALHVAAAVWHLVRRDGIAQRMLWSRKEHAA